MKEKLMLAMLPILLAGCSMAPKYEQSKDVIPETFPTNGIYSQNKEGVVTVEQLQWENYIQNADLKRAVEIALENNKDLKIAVANIEMAKAQYGVSKTDRFPSLNGTVVGNRERDGSGVSEGYQASLGLSAFELDFFGRVKSLNDVSLQSFLATKEAQKATRLAVISETAKAYYGVALAKSQLSLAKKTQEATEKSVSLIEKRVEHGIATAKDLSDAKGLYFKAVSDVSLYQTEEEKSINALRFMLGSFEEIRLPSGVEELNSSIKDISIAVSSEVLYKRPDVMAAEHQLLAANANIGAAKAAFFPRISLTTALGAASGQLSDLFSSDAMKVWSFTPMINIPIFDLAKNKANLKYSEAQKEKMIATYEKTIQSAFREVSDNLARKSTINQQIQAFDNYVQANETSFNLANKSYDAGVKDYLAVLTAQTALYGSQMGALNLQKEKFSNTVDTYKIIGY